MPSNLKSHLEVSSNLHRKFFLKYLGAKPYNTIEPGYKDIGLRGTSTIALDILCYELIPHSAIILDEALTLKSLN